jgi:hypothetical protein
MPPVRRAELCAAQKCSGVAYIMRQLSLIGASQTRRGMLTLECPLRGKSGSGGCLVECPLHPRKQTSRGTVLMSAWCHFRKSLPDGSRRHSSSNTLAALRSRVVSPSVNYRYAGASVRMLAPARPDCAAPNIFSLNTGPSIWVSRRIRPSDSRCCWRPASAGAPRPG